MRYPTIHQLACLLLACGSLSARGQEVDYNRDVRPILSDKCYTCHGPDEAVREADLRLDLQDHALRVISAGRAEDSSLFERIASTDPDEKMPPPDSGRSLTEPEIEILRRWIAQGAQWKQHWSFLPPQRPDVPSTSFDPFSVSPIDRFVFRRLEREQLSPSPPASKETLIRRVTFDLTGLPPSLAEIDAFLTDESPDAYERVVDRLLKSSRFGEHRARYWLDAARYGDTHGLHLDNERSIWPYRQWVIQAFNENKPFDQFTIEQLAGDLLPSPTLDQLVATGFNRCNVTTSEGGSIAEEYLVRYAVDRVETTSTVFMGLTAGCAVCHDHKFDPITQKEFYRLYAYFFSLTEKAMDGNALLPPPTIKVPTQEQTERQGWLEDQIAEVEETIRTRLASLKYEEPASTDALNAESEDTTPAESEPPEEPTFISLSAWEEVIRKSENDEVPKYVQQSIRKPSDKRSPSEQQDIRDYFLEHVYRETRSVFEPLHTKLAGHKQELEELEKQIPATLIMEDLPERRQAYLLVRGEYDKKGDPVEPGTPAALPPQPAETTPNRLALAQWLVRPDHPLTSRVTVNRFWQQLFGVGIVKTSEDFGSQGEWPSHPDLLDWLAVEFIESGWDVKGLLKQIVMSHTYRQSSHVSPEQFANDPDNRLLARGPRFRFDAEVIRDNALAISGLLVERVGGKSVRPYQPDGLWRAVGYSGSNTVRFVQDQGEALYRRSMYTFWKRTAPPPTMQIFDAPSREYCVVRRERTNTPKAALALMNDVQFVEAARHFAARILQEGGASTEERLIYGFRMATSRTPAKKEIQILQDTLDQFLAKYRSDPAAAAELIRLGDSASDARLDVIPFAAWTMLASTLLNLDETITKG